MECTHGEVYKQWNIHTVGNTLTKTYSRQNVHLVRHTHEKHKHKGTNIRKGINAERMYIGRKNKIKKDINTEQMYTGRRNKNTEGDKHGEYIQREGRT